MKQKDTMKKIIILFVFLTNALFLKAQDDKVKFGAYARALQSQNKISATDTLNAKKNSYGHLPIDLGVNVNPDKKTEIQAVLRFKSDFAGFYGAGTVAQLRQLYIKGILGKFMNYQLGDLYLQLSPFTFYNNYSEGQANEARIFSDVRNDYTNYENLSNRGTYWWQQGAHTDFSLDFKETFIKRIRFDAFFLRNRNTNYHAGGRILVNQSDRFKIAVNYVNLFDVGATIDSSNQGRNPVTSLELDYNLISTTATELKLFGEGGYSKLVFLGDTITNSHNKEGYFYEAGTALSLKRPGLTFKASYLYVDPEFFSSAAQTKRINFAKRTTLFPYYGNDLLNPIQRTPAIVDLIRDTAVYNPVIRRQLMAYDPTLNNSQPYGKATPNRTGVNLGITYRDSVSKIVAEAEGAYLTEIVAAGASEKRQFMVARAGIDFNIHKFLNFKKRITITTGIRYEYTSRKGSTPIELNSNLLDFGLELEVLKKFDVLAGAKMLRSTGNEFILVRNVTNDVVSYDNTITNNINLTQNLFAFGLKYRFTERTYLTVQDNFFNFDNKNNTLTNYSLNQVLVMFTMNF